MHFRRLAFLVIATLPIAAQPRSVATIVAEAEKLHATDNANALRLLDDALKLPRVAGDGGARAQALLRKCWWSSDAGTSIAAANEGLAEAVRANDARRHARLVSCRGNAFENAGRFEEATHDYAQARVEAEIVNDQETVVDALLQSGYLGYSRGDLNDALASLQQSYAIAIRIHYDEGRRTALAYIAAVYADASMAHYDKAIEYYRDLLREHERSGNQVGISDTLFNIGSTYERKGDFPSALVWYRRGLAAEEQLGRNDEAAYVKRSIAITLVKLNRSADALPLFDAALQQFTNSGDAMRIAEVRQSRGIAYRKLGRLNEAIADLEATAKYFAEVKNDRFLEKSKDEVALAYAAAHRWEDAFRARSEDAALQRTLADKLREQHTSRLKVQFDSEKKEQENRALARESTLRQRALESAHRIDRLQKIILILGAILIVVLVWLVVRHIRDARRMRTMALTDELTRLPNRRRMVAAGDALLQQTAGGGSPFSVVAFDIDHFKRINDTWGHGAGDTVLQRVAHACRGAVRPSDILGRTGGEEFTVLLPSTRLTDAVQVAERLRGSVESLDFTAIDPALRVTISLGVAEWTPSDTTLAKLTGRADEVLYRAKNSGRNRVELAVA